MAVVVLASVRSCGTTTSAVALAATWSPARKVVLVELDPAGGTLAASSGWATEPSLVSLVP
jgi:cellulose biosynthesis protein BcsQ